MEETANLPIMNVREVHVPDVSFFQESEIVQKAPIDPEDDGINPPKGNINGTFLEEYSSQPTFKEYKTRRKDETPITQMCEWIVKHQIGMIYSPYCSESCTLILTL
jgi:hypothetical protein